MPKGTSTVTQTTNPWAGQQPYLRDMFGRAQTAMNMSPTVLFSAPGFESVTDYQRDRGTPPAPQVDADGNPIPIMGGGGGANPWANMNLGGGDFFNSGDFGLGNYSFPNYGTGGGGPNIGGMPSGGGAPIVVDAPTLAGVNPNQREGIALMDAYARRNLGLGADTSLVQARLMDMMNNSALTSTLGAGQGQFQDPTQMLMGANQGFTDLDFLQGANALGTDITTIAGGRPGYDDYGAGSQISQLAQLAPDYTAGFGQSVQGATAPITRQLMEEAIPALLSEQALTGGTSSRHAISGENVMQDYSNAIGDAVARQALQLEGLKGQTFGQLAGIGGSDVADLRNLLGADYRTLVGEGGSAFRQRQDLTTGYETAGQQQQSQERMQQYQLQVQQQMAQQQIAAQAYEQAMQRALTGQEHGLTRDELALRNRALAMQAGGMIPGMEGQGWELGQQGIASLMGIGDTERAWTQEEVQDALNRFQMNLQAPWTGIDNYSSVIQGLGGGYGTQETVGPSGAPSTFTTGLQGAIGGAGLGYLGASTFGPLAAGGTAAGATGLTALGVAAPWLLGGAALGGLLGII
jgi:hypothetical protein